MTTVKDAMDLFEADFQKARFMLMFTTTTWRRVGEALYPRTRLLGIHPRHRNARVLALEVKFNEYHGIEVHDLFLSNESTRALSKTALIGSKARMFC
jgi:hypothetical protein